MDSWDSRRLIGGRDQGGTTCDRKGRQRSDVTTDIALAEQFQWYSTTNHRGGGAFEGDVDAGWEVRVERAIQCGDQIVVAGD